MSMRPEREMAVFRSDDGETSAYRCEPLRVGLALALLLACAAVGVYLAMGG